jgi:hypothetical protein
MSRTYARSNDNALRAWKAMIASHQGFIDREHEQGHDHPFRILLRDIFWIASVRPSVAKSTTRE